MNENSSQTLKGSTENLDNTDINNIENIDSKANSEEKSYED